MTGDRGEPGPQVFNILRGEASQVRATPFGDVGTVFSGSGLEMVWVSKLAEPVDEGWFSSAEVDLILVVQGQLKFEFESPEQPGRVLGVGDVLVLPAGGRAVPTDGHATRARQPSLLPPTQRAGTGRPLSTAPNTGHSASWPTIPPGGERGKHVLVLFVHRRLPTRRPGMIPFTVAEIVRLLAAWLAWRAPPGRPTRPPRPAAPPGRPAPAAPPGRPPAGSPGGGATKPSPAGITQRTRLARETGIAQVS